VGVCLGRIDDNNGVASLPLGPSPEQQMSECTELLHDTLLTCHSSLPTKWQCQHCRRQQHAFSCAISFAS